MKASIAKVSKQSTRSTRRRKPRGPRRRVLGFAPTGRQKELFYNPHVQAGAIARLAVMATFDYEQPDADDYQQLMTDADIATLKAMGLTLGSLYAREVLDVIQELSFQMEDALERAGLLASECGRKWQETKS